jgi:hypothetical protein
MKPYLQIFSVVDLESGPTTGSASNKNQDPDQKSDPHQRDKLDLDTHPHQSADDMPKCMEYEHFFRGLIVPLFGS